jgi:serine/threonine-protein kinase
VLAGRYRLLERLGEGGMSVVWRARDAVLDREVAIKLLGEGDPLRRDAVRLEAVAAAKLTHPNIASVFDYGEADVGTGEPVQFVVMELLHGLSVAELPLPLAPESALSIGADVAAALAAAHASGLAHRDIKPANVVLTSRGAKVVDFGLAAAIGTPEDDAGDRILGTPAYVAPERLTGATVGAAADVYALGVLMVRLLTGNLPESTMDLSMVEPEVGELCTRCLDPDPDRRPAAAEARALLAAASGAASSSAVVVTAAFASTAEYLPDAAPDTLSLPLLPSAVAPYADTRATQHTEWGARPAPGRRKARVALLLVAAGVLVTLVSVGILSVKGQPGAHPAFAGPTDAVTTAGAAGATSPALDAPTTAGTPGSVQPSVLSGQTAGATPAAPTAAPTATPSLTPSPTPAPTSASPTGSPTSDGGPVTFTSVGGTIQAACDGNLAYLISWTPNPGYTVLKVDPGPGLKAQAHFKSAARNVVMTVTCPAGVPQVSP